MKEEGERLRTRLRNVRIKPGEIRIKPGEE